MTGSIAITLGDPAGVGPEVVAVALAHAPPELVARTIVYGDRGPLERGARSRNITLPDVRILGDGTGANGEFGTACKAASRHYAKARDLLNRAFPDRREAVLDAAIERLQGALAGNMERITEQRAAKPQTRQIVHL